MYFTLSIIFWPQLSIVNQLARVNVSFNRLGAIFKTAILFLLLIFFSACATVKPPLVGIVAGREVETIQSAVNIFIQTGEHSTSGRAFLVFRRPDHFHLAVLSPFGLTVFEVFGDHDRLTCLVPSKQTAYSGLFSELPETSALKNISLLNWVLKLPPSIPSSLAHGEIATSSGERFFFGKDGLLGRKISEQGNEVAYEDYRAINGIAFANSIIIDDRYGAAVKIVFDEPQINQSVEESALTANLEGVSVRPLADFEAF
jgi:hypothetical protein